MVLTNAEIIEITGKSRYRAQAMALARMGVPYLIRPDGRPIVSRISANRNVEVLSHAYTKAKDVVFGLPCEGRLESSTWFVVASGKFKL